MITLFFSHVYGRMIDAWLPALIHTAFTLPVYLIATYYLVFYLVPYLLIPHHYLRALIHAIYLVLGTTLLYVAINIALVFMPGPEWTSPGPPQPHSLDVFTHMVGVYAVAFFAAALRLWSMRQAAERQAMELNHKRLEAELQGLKNQLHPHFLFNTLNSLYALALKKSPETPDLILKLSQLLDYTLYQTRSSTVPLAAEIEVLEHYMDLERTRFDQRLDLEYHFEPVDDMLAVAPLLLLPLVENAFKHGAARVTENAWIRIELTTDGDRLRFQVANAIPNHESNEVESPVHGIGLTNLRQRLEMLYPDRYQLEIARKHAEFTATLELKGLERADAYPLHDHR